MSKGAPIGNQFWKLRSKHGRDKIFESPETLWEEAKKYFEWCDENPFQEVEQRKGNIIIQKGADASSIDISPTVELPKMRAYTWEGLEIFLDVESLREYKTNPTYKDFSQVITRISKIIYNQKFSGAASGFFNPNIIARDLGLRDQSDIKHEGLPSGPMQVEIVKPDEE